MIVVLKRDAKEADLQALSEEIRKRGYQVHLSRGVERTLVGCIGAPEKDKDLLADQFAAFSFVENVVRILKPYKIVNHEFQPERSRVRIGDVVVGGDTLIVMAGPCSVESREQLLGRPRVRRRPGRTSCAGARSSQAPRPTPSMALAKRG